MTEHKTKRAKRAPKLEDILLLTSMVVETYADGSTQTLEDMAQLFPIASDILSDARVAHIVDLQTTAIHQVFLDQLVAHGIGPAATTFEPVNIERTPNPDSHQLLKLTDVVFDLAGVRFIFTVCNNQLAGLRVHASVDKHVIAQGSVLELFGEAARQSLMYYFNLNPVCPIVLLDYVDQVHDKVNVQFNIGVDPHSFFRDSRTNEHNTQVVTLYSAIRIQPDVVIAALHLPEWNEAHSEFAIVRIVDNQIVSICAPDKGQLLMEIPVPNLDHDLVVKFGRDGRNPTIMWYTPSSQEPIGAIRYALK